MSRTKVQCSKSVHVMTDERPSLVLGKKILVWTNPSIFCEIERVVPMIIAVLLKGAPPQISKSYTTFFSHFWDSYGRIVSLAWCDFWTNLCLHTSLGFNSLRYNVIASVHWQTGFKNGTSSVRRLRQESPFKVPSFVGTCVPVFIKFVHIHVFIFLVYFWIGICYVLLKFVIPGPVADPRRH